MTSIAAIRPSAPTLAFARVTIPGPMGPERNSSARAQTTFTGRPGTPRAISTASKAASSALLWP